jgi:hypothetical protein
MPSLMAETSTMFNPLFHNMSGDGSAAGSSTDSSLAGGTSAAAAAAYSASTAAAAAAGSSSLPTAVDTAAVSSTAQPFAAAEAAAAAAPAGSLFEVLDNPMYCGRSVLQWLAKHSISGGSSSSSYAGAAADLLQPSAVQHSSFSVHSSQLSAMIRERVSTENLTISTDVAPDTSRFTLGSRGSSRTISSIADTAAARGGYNAAGLSELTESLEIEYSQDGQSPAAGLAANQQQQQMLQTGDFVYVFVPSVARDILSWSGFSDVSTSSSFGTVGTLGTLHTTLGRDTLRATATLAAAGDESAAEAGLSATAGGNYQLEALLPKRWLAGGGANAGLVSGSGDSSSKLARLANAEVRRAAVAKMLAKHSSHL